MPLLDKKHKFIKLTKKKDLLNSLFYSIITLCSNQNNHLFPQQKDTLFKK